jgi:hypothetical protein
LTLGLALAVAAMWLLTAAFYYLCKYQDHLRGQLEIARALVPEEG